MGRAVLGLAMVVVAAAAAACGGGGGDEARSDGVVIDREIEVTARDVKFVPDEITISAGETVRLVLVNEDDGTEHDLEAEGMMVQRMEGGGHGGGHDAGDMLALHTMEGETSEIVFVAETPGTYAIYCTVSGHRDAGMVGTITVV